MSNLHKDRAHAILAPSASKRWMECPASVHWSSRIESEETEWSKKGTQAHEYAEKALRLALNDKSPQPIYDKIGDKTTQNIVEDWVNFCVQLYRRIQIVADDTPYFFIEEKVRVSEHIWGTLDFAIVFKKEGKVYLVAADLKTGAGVPVSVERNTQLMIYAEGLCRGQKVIPEAIHIYIFQPQVYDEPQKEKIPGEEFRAEIVRIERAAVRAVKFLEHVPFKQDYKAGEWCRFCPALGQCPETMRENTQAIAKGEANPGLLPVSDLVQILNKKSQIEDWLADVERTLLLRLIKGGKVPGYKLVRGRANRRWIDDSKKVAAGLVKLGVKNPYTQGLLTIGEVEREIGKDVKGLNKLYEKGEGKLTICMDSDPRPALEDTSLNLMTEIETKDEQGNEGTKSVTYSGDVKRRPGAKKPVAKRVSRKAVNRTNHKRS